MEFYPAKNNDRLNRRAFTPEAIGGRVMVNPRYPIRELQRIPPWWCWRCASLHTFPRVRCDSGAFQDIGKRRLEPRQALEAQLRFEEQLRWWLDDHDFHFECLFIYDDPAGIDEAVIDGKKVKVRGTEETARAAVANTIAAARYYAKQRERIKGAIGWVGQGIDAAQYVACVEAMLPLMLPSDIFAFGGFCILGRMPRRMMETYQETVERVAPLVRAATGIAAFHLLGVMYAPGIRWAAELAADMEAAFATDGSGPEQAACVAGRGYRDGRQVDAGFTPADKYKEYHPCQLALENIAAYHAWASSLSSQATSAPMPSRISS